MKLQRTPAAEIVARATAPIAKGVTIDLSGLEVAEPIDLSGATLGNVDFSGSRFAAPFVARGATFAGLAWFKGSSFGASLDLSRALLCNDLRMKGAVVQGAATFSRAELRGVGELDLARFEDRVDLDGLVVFGNMSMAGTEFRAPVTLQGCDFLGGLWCEGARFAARADFRGVEVHGRTWLKRTTVAGTGLAQSRGALHDIQSYGYRWL